MTDEMMALRGLMEKSADSDVNRLPMKLRHRLHGTIKKMD